MSTLPPGYPTDLIEAFKILKTRTRLSQEDVTVLALIESSGEAFYKAAANAIKNNDEARALLARNGREERGHAHRLVKALGLMGAAGFTLPEDSANPFVRGLPADMSVNDDFLSMLARSGTFISAEWCRGNPPRGARSAGHATARAGLKPAREQSNYSRGRGSRPRHLTL
jgi:hypothetical protein